MDSEIIYILIIIGILGGIGLALNPVDSAIPPTPAFQIINTTSGNVTAFTYNDVIKFLGVGITITPDYNSQTITFTGSGSSNSSSPKVNNQTALRDYQITGINNVTGVITTNQFSVNSIDCGSNFVSTIDNATGQTTCKAGTTSTLRVDNQTQTRGNFITGINNATGDITRQIFKVNNQTTSPNTFITGINNLTGVITTGTASASSSLRVDNQTKTNGNFIVAINNATGDITRQIFKVNNQTTASDQFINGIDNQTGQIRRANFSVNTNTCSGSEKISAINNVTGQVTCSTVTASGGATSLAANVTSSLTGNLSTLVQTIPLTANSGNALNFVLVAASNTNGVAPQIGLNTTVSGSRGWCTWVHPVTATTTEIDFVSANSTNRYVRDTGATAWITTTVNDPMPITGQCVIKTGATPGDAKLYLQAETTGTVTIKAGSFYIKTP